MNLVVLASVLAAAATGCSATDFSHEVYIRTRAESVGKYEIYADDELVTETVSDESGTALVVRRRFSSYEDALAAPSIIALRSVDIATRDESSSTQMGIGGCQYSTYLFPLELERVTVELQAGGTLYLVGNQWCSGNGMTEISIVN